MDRRATFFFPRSGISRNHRQFFIVIGTVVLFAVRDEFLLKEISHTRLAVSVKQARKMYVDTEALIINSFANSANSQRCRTFNYAQRNNDA